MPDLFLDRPYPLQELCVPIRVVSTFPPDLHWGDTVITPHTMIIYDTTAWYRKREFWIRVVLGLIAIAGWLR